MMTLITGFTCPPTIYFKFITKCDKCYYKVRQLFLLQSAMVCYYKGRQLFYYKVRQVLLQSATGITKCDNFITKCDWYYKVRQYTSSSKIFSLLKCLKLKRAPSYFADGIDLCYRLSLLFELVTAFTSSPWSGGICRCLIIYRHRCFTIASSYLFLQLHPRIRGITSAF